MGEHFCLPFKNKDKIVTEFLKNTEHRIGKLPAIMHPTDRSRAIPIIKKLTDLPLSTLIINNDLSRAASLTNRFTCLKIQI